MIDLSNDRCDPEIHEYGEIAAWVDACRIVAEKWVKRIAEKSAQRVDWHYVGGRVLVLFIGDREGVLSAIGTLAPELGDRPAKLNGEECRCIGDRHGGGRVIQVGE